MTIQSRFRGFLCRKWYAKVHKIRTEAAVRIQRFWRSHYATWVKIRNHWSDVEDVVEWVQCCVKGFLSRKKVSRERGEQRIEATY